MQLKENEETQRNKEMPTVSIVWKKENARRT